MKRASYSSKRDLLSSFDREQVHQDHGSEADEQPLNCAPRWEAEFRQVNLYIRPTSLYKTSFKGLNLIAVGLYLVHNKQALEILM